MSPLSVCLRRALQLPKRGTWCCETVARGAIDPSAIRRVTERANGWRSETEVLADRHILSPQRGEKRRGYGLDSGGANNLGTTWEIRPTISSVAFGLPTPPSIRVWLPARFQQLAVCE